MKLEVIVQPEQFDITGLFYLVVQGPYKHFVAMTRDEALANWIVGQAPGRLSIKVQDRESNRE